MLQPVHHRIFQVFELSSFRNGIVLVNMVNWCYLPFLKFAVKENEILVGTWIVWKLFVEVAFLRTAACRHISFILYRVQQTLKDVRNRPNAEMAAKNVFFCLCAN